MTLFGILVTVTFLVGLIILGLNKLYKNPKKPHQTTPAKFHIPFQEIGFSTKNDCQLYGWWMPVQNKASDFAPTLILVHGWGRNVERMMPYIQNLHPKGFNLLAFDSRNHGSSDSDSFSSLLKFAEDIRSAIDFVEERVDVDAGRIGVIGLSVGGAAAIYAAAHDNRIKSVVTAGAFAHPADIMRMEFQKRHIPYFPLVWLLFKYIQHKIGATFEQIAPINNIQNISAKILLIHGNQDVIVPLEQGQKLKNAGDPEKIVLWTIPGKGHSNYHSYPGFWEKVGSFLREAL